MHKTLLVSDNNVFPFSNTFLRLGLLCLTIFAATTAHAQQPFITTWKTDLAGTSNSTSITIPTTGVGYNYYVDWNNDGTYDELVTGGVTHDFGVAGTYTIRIRGTFPRIFFNFAGDRQKLLDVAQWGEIAWTSMQSAFNGCSNLNVSATDLPNLSGVTNMSSMFNSCFSLNGPANIGNWNTSNVTNMSSMFANAMSFNQPIGNWNTANVTRLESMFFQATAFNQPVRNWNTANVTNMSYMFYTAIAFNQPVGNWNVANVTNLDYMFNSGAAFNQSLGDWALNPGVLLTHILGFSGLDCRNYSATLIGWNANPATPNNRILGLTGLLYGTNAVAAHANLVDAKGWTFVGDFASGTDCSPLPFVTTWKTDNPGESNNTSITIPTTGGGYNYEVDWDNDGIYDQTGITGDITHDFGVAGNYTIQIRGVFPQIYFSGSGDRRKLLDVSQWGDIAWASMHRAFLGCSNLNISATDVPDLSGVTVMASMFERCTSLNSPANIGDWNTSNVKYMDVLFSQATAFNQPIGNWNTANVLSMSAILELAEAFNQPIGNWNTANVTSMGAVFSGATAFNQPIGNWNTANVTDMSSMFFGAIVFNQPIGNWNTGKATEMGNMFYDAAAFNQPIGNWNTASVNNMGSMFNGATDFNQPIGSWNTANVINMSGMFLDAIAFNQPIGDWNIASVINMNVMFSSATAFNQSLGDWSLNPSVVITDMLNNTGMDCEQYSATLNGWNSNPATPNGRLFGAIGRLYGTNAVAARINLESAKGWEIYGDAASGADCSPLPVTLVSFTGKSQENGVLLTWETTSETNNSGFEIEKSANARTFEKIGFVDGAGDTNVRRIYNFRDTNPWPTTYYRLKQLDHAADRQDSKFEYSRIISVKQSEEQIVVYPNPTSNILHLKGLTKDQKLVVRNAEGKVVHKQLWSSGNAVKVGHLPAGMYFLSVGGETKKIIVQKGNL